MQENNSYNQHTELINLIKNLVYNLGCLIFQHLKFFKEEIKEEAHMLIKSVILLWIAISMGLIAAFFGGILLIITFSIFFSLWWSLLFITLLFLLISFVLFIYIKFQFKKIPKKQKKVAEETSKTLEEIKKWLEQLKS